MQKTQCLPDLISLDKFIGQAYVKCMIIRKAKKYRLKIRHNKLDKFSQAAGCQRFVWNKFLALQKQCLESGEYRFFYAKMCKELTELKKNPDFDFLSNVHSQTLQQTLKDLDRALSHALAKTKGFPKFKKKGVHDSFRYPQGCKVYNNRIYLPKVGWFCLFSSSELEGQVKNVVISRRGKHWYASVQVELEVEEPKHSSSSIVGIDMGIVRFATLSNGEYFEPLNSFQRLERNLRIEQRKLSRKVKFSKNWNKQKKRIQNVHIQIANVRQDYLHKLTHNISKNHACVVLEDLAINKMSSTQEDSGKHKRNLNKKILDQGWYEFRRQLEYKLLWHGGKVLLVDPQNTSRTCPKCSYVSANNRKTQSQFECGKCGNFGNADWIAACNILMAVGHTVAACGDTAQSIA
jgi:putative transposase